MSTLIVMSEIMLMYSFLQAAGAERHYGSPSQGVRCMQKDEQNVSIEGAVCACVEN
jgi:hypothetical protein